MERPFTAHNNATSYYCDRCGRLHDKEDEPKRFDLHKEYADPPFVRVWDRVTLEDAMDIQKRVDAMFPQTKTKGASSGS